MITPVIMAGGSGTRLWPLSRASHPKQFLALSVGTPYFSRLLSGGLVCLLQSQSPQRQRVYTFLNG